MKKQLNLFEKKEVKIWRAWQIVHKTHEGRTYLGDKVWFQAEIERDQVMAKLKADGYRNIEIAMAEKEER